MYECKAVADSIGPHKIRLTTFEVVFPRIILAELNTHRILSRNSASSRAIPTEILIQHAKDNPFVPDFNERVTGMGVGAPLSDQEQGAAVANWLKARDAAVNAAQNMLHVDKSRANRLLEPFLWQKALISGTDWRNFLALRADKEAQPEFQVIAHMIGSHLQNMEPKKLDYNEWHLPLVEPDEPQGVTGAEISAGRCAKVSYDRHNDREEYDVSRGRWTRLSGAGHWSPGEHPAVCVMEGTSNLGNYTGWKQLRKFYANEAVYDRV